MIEVPGMRFPIGKVYITVYIENYFGDSSSTSRILNVMSDSTTLSVKMLGNSITKIYASEELNLVTKIGNMTCVDIYPNNSLSFSWAVYNGMQIDYSKLSVSNDPMIFRLPPYSTIPGTMLTIQVGCLKIL